MAKRKTKAQREQEQYDALYQRVSDIMLGACGHIYFEEMDYMCLSDASRFVPALKTAFGREYGDSTNHYLFSLHSLDEFDCIESTTKHLFDGGVRA